MRIRLRGLSAIFGDGRAIDEIRSVAINPALDARQRRQALQFLIESRPPDLREVCEQLLSERELTVTAATGLALYDDSSVAERILSEMGNLMTSDRPAMINVLLSRPAWAKKVLDAIEAGTVQRDALTAFQARQIRSFHDPALTRQLENVWGPSTDESEATQRTAMSRWHKRLDTARLQAADRDRGRAHFTSLCSACHTLNGEGGKIGPDLTGAARDNLDYLLENILFPSAVVPNEYRLTTLTLKDGRVMAGMIRSRTKRIIRLQTMTELVTVLASEVANEETSGMSLMPPGLIEGLNDKDAADLIAYLRSKA
jgi:putative heme-binding domain-containing protein